MPFVFDPNVTDALSPSDRCIEDRTSNPVRNRSTLYRLRQQNMLAYTFPDFIPGFAQAGMNRHPFDDVVDQPVRNALAEGAHYFSGNFEVASNARAKVSGDIFQEIESAVLWNAACRWNHFMATNEWTTNPRYTKPTLAPNSDSQITVLNLPRRYDWVRLLEPGEVSVIEELRSDLRQHDLHLPTSTPDILVVRVPPIATDPANFSVELEGLDIASQKRLDHAFEAVEGKLQADDILLAIAVKRSLRSDRLYQPLYEANIMQLLLEGRLGAPQVDFEVHTLEYAGTAAVETYKAASLGGVATSHANPHRAVRDLYKPKDAAELVDRFFRFLEIRLR